MSNWFEGLGTAGLTVLKWPYPVRYGVENQISAIGGGSHRFAGQRQRPGK